MERCGPEEWSCSALTAGVGAVHRSAEVGGQELEAGSGQHRLQQPPEGAVLGADVGGQVGAGVALGRVLLALVAGHEGRIRMLRARVCQLVEYPYLGHATCSQRAGTSATSVHIDRAAGRGRDPPTRPLVRYALTPRSGDRGAPMAGARDHLLPGRRSGRLAWMAGRRRTVAKL